DQTGGAVAGRACGTVRSAVLTAAVIPTGGATPVGTVVTAAGPVIRTGGVVITTSTFAVGLVRSALALVVAARRRIRGRVLGPLRRVVSLRLREFLGRLFRGLL